MASTPRRPWSEQEAARALADVYQVLLRDHVAEYRQALAQAIDAARDAIAKAQGEGLPADQVLEHAKAAALSHVAEADAAAIAARLLQGEGVSE